MHNICLKYQEMSQDIQDFSDQYMAICKVRTELGFKFGQCKDFAKALLPTEGLNEPSIEQLSCTLDWVKKENHAIGFYIRQTGILLE